MNNISEIYIRRIMKMLGFSYLGAFQKKVVQSLVDNPYIILQMSRQTGKTFLVGIMCLGYMMMGKTVILAYPTLKQAEKIIFGDLRRYVRIMMKYYPHAMNPLVNNQSELKLANGGRALIFTTEESARSREGFSGDLLVIDEAHKASPDIMKDLSPILNRARIKDEDRVIILGIGGYRNSLITTLRKKKNFISVLYDCWYILSSYPQFQKVIDSERETLSPEEFAQQYELKDVAVGERYPFTDVVETINANGRALPYAGIDVGRKKDSTLVSVGMIYPDKSIQVIDHLELVGLPFKEQAAKIVPFLRSYNVPEPYTMIELNSIGQSLMEAMLEYSQGYNGMVITGESKQYLVEATASLCRMGKLGIASDDFRNEIYSLTYSIDENGKVTYAHSDFLSSLLMLVANLYYR